MKRRGAILAGLLFAAGCTTTSTNSPEGTEKRLHVLENTANALQTAVEGDFRGRYVNSQGVAQIYSAVLGTERDFLIYKLQTDRTLAEQAHQIRDLQERATQAERDLDDVEFNAWYERTMLGSELYGAMNQDYWDLFLRNEDGLADEAAARQRAAVSARRYADGRTAEGIAPLTTQTHDLGIRADVADNKLGAIERRVDALETRPTPQNPAASAQGSHPDSPEALRAQGRISAEEYNRRTNNPPQH